MAAKRMHTSRVFHTDRRRAYDVVLVAPLTQIFSRRHLAIARIAEVIGGDGVWGRSVGQRRTIVLSDGATMLETLTAIDAPNRFSYTITELSGPLKALVSGADGTWQFGAVGTATEITWTWEVTPRGLIGRLAMPVFARMWSGYARRAMDQIELLLVSHDSATQG